MRFSPNVTATIARRDLRKSPRAGGCKGGIMEALQMLNITRETMYPGLETSAKAVMESYRQQRQ